METTKHNIYLATSDIIHAAVLDPWNAMPYGWNVPSSDSMTKSKFSSSFL